MIVQDFWTRPGEKLSSLVVMKSSQTVAVVAASVLFASSAWAQGTDGIIPDHFARPITIDQFTGGDYARGGGYSSRADAEVYSIGETGGDWSAGGGFGETSYDDANLAGSYTSHSVPLVIIGMSIAFGLNDMDFMGQFGPTTCPGNLCGTRDFNGDSIVGNDQDEIDAFFACLGGNCCERCFCQGSDFNGDGDFGTDQDIEAFFRVLAGGSC
jgi:hypothetical protein